MNLVLLDADSHFARVPPPTVDAEEGDVELRRTGEVYPFDCQQSFWLLMIGLRPVHTTLLKPGSTGK